MASPSVMKRLRFCIYVAFLLLGCGKDRLTNEPASLEGLSTADSIPNAPEPSMVIESGGEASSGTELGSLSQFDTINQIVLKKLYEVRIYTGGIRDSLYVFNGVLTYGFREDWERLFPATAAEFLDAKAVYPSVQVDSVNLPVKRSGRLNISSGIVFEDDSTEGNLQIYDSYGFVFDRKILLVSRMGLHKKDILGVSLDAGKIDTLVGIPIQFGNRLLSCDLELATDSKHQIAVYLFDGEKLNLLNSFSLGQYFGIRPEEAWLQNDSVLMVRELERERYWRVHYRSLGIAH